MVSVSAMALIVAGIPEVGLAAAAPVGPDAADTVIVTGTRDVGVKATESAAPIQVVGAEALEQTGATSAFDALKDILPSFSANGWSADQSELIRAARLRGMNPGETLILVNGKRRHQSGSVTPGGSDESPDSGSNPADLDMIPVSMIDHVEVLLDGAAAQYGSDAVAGVINIILKSAASGSHASAGGAISSRGDGAQGTASGSQGIALGSDGYLDLGVDYRHNDFSNRNSANCRTYLNGCGGTTAGEVNRFGVTNGPVRNRLEGQPLSDLTNIGFNLEKGLNGTTDVYAFGTFGRRSAQAFENNREDSRAPFYWPDGFFPRQLLNEVDYQITAGLRGKLAGWDWDVSGSDASDSNHFSVRNTYNTGHSNPPTYAAHPGLGLDTTTTGGALYSFYSKQAMADLDIRRSFDNNIFASPLNVAAGAEYRHESYQLTSGSPYTYEDGGTQSESGATPQDASNHSRNVEAVYVDLSTKVLPKWLVDAAGRFEDYSQSGVGSTETGKLTTRYDVTPELAVRGTVSTGFHAPSLAQSYFSLSPVTPGAYIVQGPPTSAGAVLMGAQPLKPETSKDTSIGIVIEPMDRMHVTVDAYQIWLDKAIIGTSLIGGPVGLQAMALNGHAVPASQVSQAFYGFNFFQNAVNTRTRGLDINADYKTDFQQYGSVKWTAAANFNSATIVGQAPLNPKTLAAEKAAAAVGQWVGAYTLVNPQIVTDVTKASPANKVTVAADWAWHRFDVTVRETRYGHADETNGTTTAVTPYSNIYIKSAYITDLDISYMATDSVKLNIGGNNVFDKLPGRPPTLLQQNSRESNNYPYYTPWGIMGAYFYSKVSVSF